MRINGLKTMVGILLAALLLAGCASPGSNTGRDYKKEHMAIIVAKPDTDGKIVAADVLVDTAVKLVTKAVVYGIKREAQKYEANYGTTESFDNNKNHLTNGASIVVVRCVSEMKSKDGKSVFTSCKDFTDDLLKDTKILNRTNIASAFSTNSVLSNANYFVTMAALLELKPATNGVQYLTLTDFYYPGLKAKNIKGNIPLTSWDETKSLLTVELKGPNGFDLKKYQATFKVEPTHFKWDKHWQEKTNGVWTHLMNEPIRSEPFDALTSLPVVQIKYTIVESSNLKKTLEQFGDWVKDLDIKSLTTAKDE